MSLFGNLKIDEESLNENTDKLGGGLGPLESGLYKATIEVAYGTVSKTGALGLVVKFLLNLANESTPRPFTNTFWISNKNQENFYVNSKGEKHPLAGFTHANHLCALLTGKSVVELGNNAQERQLKLYNPEAKQEVLTSVPVLVDLIDKEVILGIKKIHRNKQEAGSDGNYVDTNKEQIINEIDKIFVQKGNEIFTHDELRAKAEVGEFVNKWAEKWTDVTDDRYKEVKSSGTSTVSATRKLGIG